MGNGQYIAIFRRRWVGACAFERGELIPADCDTLRDCFGELRDCCHSSRDDDWFLGSRHNVKALNVTHCSFVAIPLRLSLRAGVPAYQGNTQARYYLSEERLWAYTNFYDYPVYFGDLSQDEQQVGIKI